MGRRLQAWGNQDLKDERSHNLHGPLENASRRHPNPPQAWKSVPNLLGKTLDDAVAKISRVQNLLYSETGLEDDETWYARRPIGAGAYGVAALFEKLDNNGQVLDVRDRLHTKVFTELGRNWSSKRL
jgi:hypothetical protein